MKGAGEVLLVEDDPDVRHSTAKLLRSMGFHVLEAGDGNAALSLLQETAKVELLFTDMVMPGGMTGVELAAKARVACPDLKVLFMSGYADGARFLEGTGEEGAIFLSKPFDSADLARGVREALHRDEG